VSMLKQLTNENLFVITGGPGAGKTAILEELQRRGYACVPEAARAIIQEQVRIGGDAVPWRDTQRYASLMLQKSIEDYRAHADAERITFFDRGILDTLTHARVNGFRLPEEAYLQAEKHRYNRVVFMAPPWPEIYATDTERKQTLDESLIVYQINADVYREYGYDTVEIPLATVNERADFILKTATEALS
jgi:predicted ATPase